MKKRLMKVAITTALTVAFAVPAFANPFADVPAKHWAYDAVNKLAQAGIVDGYGDGTFRGDKTMTRYEMAQIIAKAMTKNLNGDNKATVDKLSKEFATELNNLGVKVDGLQKQVDSMVKISGDARIRYGAVENTGDQTDFRARVAFDGKVNENIKFNARLTSGNIAYNANPDKINLDTANVTFKALGLTNTLGRQDFKLGTGAIVDDKITGLAAQTGALKLFAGNMVGAERVYAAEYGFNAMGAKVTADYFKNETSNDEIYGANASFGLAKNVTANVEYLNNNATDATALAYGVKFNKLGLTATYRDVEAGALHGKSTLYGDINAYADGAALKGMEYQYDRALDKNTNLTIKHQDFDGLAAQTKATVSVKF